MKEESNPLRRNYQRLTKIAREEKSIQEESSNLKNYSKLLRLSQMELSARNSID
jgi:hypothetical protein